MFHISKFLIQSARDNLRRNVRLYCNSGKQQFKQSQAADLREENAQKNEKNEETNHDAEESDSESNESTTNLDNQLMHRGEFKYIAQKDRDTFISMVHIFTAKDKHRRNHVEFILAALKHMREFGVERDLAVYKELIDVMPKGKFIATNMFQEDFMHYPKQQNCIIDVLDQMEYNGVMGDIEVEQLIANIFGRRSHPYYKFQRMMYWMPKFKNLSPWLLPDPVPSDALELAKLAVRQMCTIDVESAVEVFDTADVDESIDKTWIVSGQSPEQKALLSEHPKNSPLSVEGPYTIWLRDRSLKYFTLVGEAEPDEKFAAYENPDDVRNMQLPNFLQFMRPQTKDVVKRKPDRSIHQQDDGTIYAICATGTSTKDSLLSWIRLLEKSGNPRLAVLPTLFKFRVPIDDRALVVVNDSGTRK